MHEYEYLRLSYNPKEDIVCLFRVEPAKGVTFKEAAEHIALESSIGTWTQVASEKKYMLHLAAKIFHIDKAENLVKIAYPAELFERGNAPNILSSIAGNIFGMKAVKNLRLEDVQFPKSILKGFSGPALGLNGIRKVLDVKDRPFLGTIIKPKLGLNPRDHANCAYDAWLGGCDFVKDDENLSSQDFNKFETRLSKTLEMKDKAEEETGEKKAYLVNVTAESNEMVRRAELVKKQGGKFVMVDVLTAGFAGVQTLREANLGLGLHGHRAMHAAFTRNKRHGISMMVLADFARLIGIDSLHIGTGIGKLEGKARDILEIEQEIENRKVSETRNRLKQDWRGLKPTLAVCSGGLHPGHVPFLIRHFGNDISIQMGGGIHGHPDGTRVGAIASRQAIDATLQGFSLEDYAKKYPELRDALKFFKKKK